MLMTPAGGERTLVLMQIIKKIIPLGFNSFVSEDSECVCPSQVGGNTRPALRPAPPRVASTSTTIKGQIRAAIATGKKIAICRLFLFLYTRRFFCVVILTKAEKKKI